ncbi:hypothetical protein BGZ83_007699 [Gryganskiella cystojenkinii]|nr:hypothetical protein BGZ83_007699 [Gryganskiella cystojenkinii]
MTTTIPWTFQHQLNDGRLRDQHQEQLQQKELQPIPWEPHALERLYSALDIPEIFLLVIDLLDHYSVVQCLQVCQRWYNCLLPMVWRTVALGYVRKHPDKSGPIDDTVAFLKHAHLIQELEISGREFLDLPPDGALIQCLSLKTLSLYSHWHYYKRKQDPVEIAKRESCLVDLIRRHQRTLEVIKLNNTQIFSEELFQVLKGCPRLRHLEQEEDFSNGNRWITRQYEELWSRGLIETLCLKGPVFDDKRFHNPIQSGEGENESHVDEGVDEKSDTFPLDQQNDADLTRKLLSRSTTTTTTTLATTKTRIREMEIKSYVCQEELDKGLIRMILNSPDLTRLGWDVFPKLRITLTTASPMAILARAARQQLGESGGSVSSNTNYTNSNMPQSSLSSIKFCPRIRSLSLRAAHFQIEDFETVICSLPALTSLDLSMTNFNFRSCRILMNVNHGRYQNTLTELFLKGCRHIQGKVLQTILVSFPNLRVFQADNLFRRDLVLLDVQGQEKIGNNRDPRLWACLDLKELAIFFDRTFFVDARHWEYSQWGPLERNEESDDDGGAQEGEHEVLAIKDIVDSKDGTEDKTNMLTTTSTTITTTAVSSAASCSSFFHKISTESLIFSRLATLRHLEVLDMRVEYIPKARRILKFDLRHGLDQLRHLKRLRVLHGPDVHNQIFYWGEKEALWVLENWPRLQILDSVALDVAAETILKEGGVDCGHFTWYGIRKPNILRQ